MASWPEIKAGIFAGESGGDYDALFGFSNRPGRQFAGTRVTDMTVDEAINFSNPRGPYAQWVKGQIGRVATPMGGFQVVGTTLREAKEGLGLTGSERMTPELQDTLGQYILAKQGTGAWEGYKGPRTPTPNATAEPGNYDPRSDTPSSAQPVGSELPGQPVNQYALPRVRHPPNPTVGTGLPPAMAEAEEEKPTSWWDKLGKSVGAGAKAYGKAGRFSYDVPQQPGPARVDVASAPIIDPQRAEMMRQQLAMAMARLNQGTLF